MDFVIMVTIKVSMDTSNKINLDCTCIICVKQKTIQVNKSDYTEYNNGKLIQLAFPYLNSNDRELIRSGICGDCYDSIFKEDDDIVEGDYFDDNAKTGE